MAFKTLFLAHAPDADYKKHNSTINTGKYRLFTYVVKNQEEAGLQFLDELQTHQSTS